MPTPAVNLLLDCTVSFAFAAADAGGGETFGSPTTIKVDKITTNEQRAHANHATNQDLVANHRKNGVDWTVTVETKLYSSALQAALQTNDVCRMIVTAPSGLGVTAIGLIVNVTPEFSGPSTIRFELVAHGTGLTWA